jgi:hypothetical protein
MLSNRPSIKEVQQKHSDSMNMVAMPKNTTVVNQTVQRPQQPRRQQNNSLNNVTTLAKMVKQYMDTPTDITKTGPSTPGYSVGMDLSGETAIMKADAAQTVPSPAAIGTATGQNAGIVAATSEPVVGSGTALQAGLKSTSVDWGTLAGAGAKETGVSDAALDIAPNVVLNPGELGSITSDAIGANIKAEALIGARPGDYFANFMPTMSPGVIASGAAGTIAGAELGKWASRELDIGGEKEGKAVGGILGGATAGAAAGTLAGGVGAIPGAITGGLIGGIGQLFSIF